MNYNFDDYMNLILVMPSLNNYTAEYLRHLWISSYQSDQQNKYSKPMPWIGMYIAFASLFCIFAMVADLLHGFRKKKLWFPCKYFTLNAASLTVIAVAIKLPMDLSTLMPGYMDQATKLGSMGFMCTMMANLLPSLATMESKELVSNIIALAVLVITLAVNICIQLNTGALFYHVVDDGAGYYVKGYAKGTVPTYVPGRHNRFTAAIYVGMLLMLLIIYVCSSLAILKSKQILESKYQAAHRKALKAEELQQPGKLLTVEKLKRHVRNYWIMAGSGNPQFLATCFATTSASAVICVSSVVLQILLMLWYIDDIWDFKSDYKWSMTVILIIQFFGMIVGTIAPLSRCFTALSFKLSIEWIWNHLKVSKVETYWAWKLSDWKQSSIPFPSSSRRCKIVMENLKILILNICIGFQMTVVIACKITAVVPFFFVICVLYCLRCWEWLKSMLNTSCIVMGKKPKEQVGKDKDLSGYVLQLQDNIEFAETTLKGMLKSVDYLIRKAEKQQPKNLMKLIAQSGGFEGVERFDSHHVQHLHSKEYLNCWSLPLITLTTIAMSLPNIQTNIVNCLLSGVSEGLVYVTLVEESLNSTDDEVIIRKAAKALWVEVEVYHKWLGNKLLNPAPQVNTTGHILQCLSDTAKNIVTEVESTDIGGRNDNSIFRCISAKSMYRITETILLSYHVDIDQFSHEELFAQLSSMIADILAACLTNLPQVIVMKSHTSAIEKREASVHDAAQLLGETTQIINNLQDRELPSLNPDELLFIDK